MEGRLLSLLQDRRTQLTHCESVELHIWEVSSCQSLQGLILELCVSLQHQEHSERSQSHTHTRSRCFLSNESGETDAGSPLRQREPVRRTWRNHGREDPVDMEKGGGLSVQTV